jgi:hypothetical protein
VFTSFGVLGIKKLNRNFEQISGSRAEGFSLLGRGQGVRVMGSGVRTQGLGFRAKGVGLSVQGV